MVSSMKLSPQRAERLALTAFVLQLVFFGLAYYVGLRANSVAVLIEGWHFLGGAGVWLVLVLQFRQRRLAEEERFDAEQYERLRREGKDTSVFEGTAVEGSMHLAARRLAWLEKYLLSIFSVLSASYLLGMGYWLFVGLRGAGVRELAGHEIRLESAAYLAGLGLVSFLFSRYAVGMSHQAAWRPLRAGGSYLLSNALACFALAVVILVADAGYASAESYVGYVLVGLMLAIGIEIVLNLVLDAYRPRVKSQYRRAAYESRLLGLFSEPGGLLRTAAHAIDYQFGFKVSETWFFKLLWQAFVPLLILQGLALYLLTSVAIIEPGHVGVLERFGRPQNIADPYGSGLHLKLPWPIDSVRSFPIEQLQVLRVGFKPKPAVLDRRGVPVADYTPILWTEEHWQEEYSFMVAVSESRVGESVGGESDSGHGGAASDRVGARSDFDLLILALVVQYRIEDIAKYGYGEDKCYLAGEELLEDICYRETLHYAAQSDMERLLGPGRSKTTEALREAMQGQVDQYEMGVEIVFVGLEAVHPPIQVAESFEKVVSALQEKQAKILTAGGEAQEILHRAVGETKVLNAEARAYAFRRAAVSKAEGERFGRQLEAFKKGKGVYLEREYLSVLDKYLPAMRKYVLASDKVNRWVYELDLKEKLQPDLFEGLDIPKGTEQERHR